MSDTLALIGMGNAEMGDDGIGVLLVEKLREELESGAWKPATSRRIRCSTAGRDPVLAGACLMEASSALLVDAADMKAASGDFRVFSLEEAAFNGRARASESQAEVRSYALSAHTLPLGHVLEMVKSLGGASRIRLMGVQPDRMDPGSGLSDRLRERMPEMLDRIKEEVSLLP